MKPILESDLSKSGALLVIRPLTTSPAVQNVTALCAAAILTLPPTFSMAQDKFEQKHDEPLFLSISRKDPELATAITAAQRSLPHFRALLATLKDAGATPLVKSRFIDQEGYGVWLWLAVVETRKDSFLAQVFEAPPDLTDMEVGTRHTLPDAKVSDWMVITDGTLHGGYSIRLQRSRQPESERASFDEYIGAERYAPLPQ